MHQQPPHQISRQVLWAEDPLTGTSPADAKTDAKRPSSALTGFETRVCSTVSGANQTAHWAPGGRGGWWSLPPRRHGAQETQRPESWLRGTESTGRDQVDLQPGSPRPPSQAWPDSHLWSRETLSRSPRRPEGLRWRLVDRPGSPTPRPGLRGRSRPPPPEPAGTASGERRRPTAQQQPADSACPGGLPGFGSEPESGRPPR